MQEVIVTVDVEGNPTVAVHGVKGTGCKVLTKEFERSLGSVIKDAATREAYEAASVSVRSRN